MENDGASSVSAINKSEESFCVDGAAWSSIDKVENGELVSTATDFEDHAKTSKLDSNDEGSPGNQKIRCSSGFQSTLHEKRKIDDYDEHIVQAKRKYQTSLSSKDSEDDSDNCRFEIPPPLQSLVNDVSPQEIEELRKKLQEGYFENYFSWAFWQSLHSNYGSTLGYAFGFMLILFLNYNWMLEEFADATEGHSVAKTFVVLFVIYSYSFITLGLELVQLAFLMMELYFPRYCKKIREYANCTISKSENLKKLQSYKYIYTPFAIALCVLAALAGSILWKWFWWNHICKSYHDRTCRGSWLGKLVIEYRDEACYDGTASSMICERFVSYLPIMLFSVFIVFLGNVLMPLLNDRLSAYYPMSETLDAAFDIIDRMSDESINAPEASVDSETAINKNRGCNENDLSPFLRKSLNEAKVQTHIVDGNIIVYKLRKIVPAGLGVLILLLIDWIIVKKFFP